LRQLASLLRELTCRVGSHTRHRWHSRLYPNQLRLVGLLDLATPEGYKAEFYVSVLYVCVHVIVVKEKRLEISTPNLVLYDST